MKGLILDFKDLSDAREIIEQKTPRFMLYFFYFVLLIILAILTWSYFAEKEIVVKAQGMVIPDTKQSITPLVSGNVNLIYFKEGDLVNKGDLILELEHDALIESLNYYKNGMYTSQYQINLNIKFEQSIMELNNLFDKNNKDEMGNYYEVQSFLSMYDLKETDELKEEYKSQKLVEIYNQIKSNENYLKQYEIEVLKCENEIKNHKFYAEIDGIVHYINSVSIGDTLQAGYEVIRVNSNTNNNKLQIYVSNQDIAKIYVGQVIRVDVAALSNREYGFGQAKVTNIETDTRINQQSGQSYYVIEAELITQTLESEKGKQALKVGMIVDSRMITGEQKYLFWFIEKLGLWMFD